ncbi:hypothetical protein EG68_04196 [Paragonimus skrjabini miyazakii]|uniref:Uncharacterized protein n=1 Tax=Paragonimus skrjabini miyazakii TaxID=59628 RepID=A0A8S9YUU0_9TREM|nr:hypothetical protein EG68_04196 [Paragonimus skrjabini miyazakii]
MVDFHIRMFGVLFYGSRHAVRIYAPPRYLSFDSSSMPRYLDGKVHTCVLCIEHFVYLADLIENLAFISLFTHVLKALSFHPSLFVSSGILFNVSDGPFWNIVNGRLYKHILIEEAMAWFSTLGGGFSSLGESCQCAAEVAGRISLVQMKLAMEMNSSIIQAKTALWFSQSLMQQGYLRESAKILRSTYIKWKPLMNSDTPADRRVDLMAAGLWERLRYYWRCRRLSSESTETSSFTLSKRRRTYNFPDLSAFLKCL